MWYRLLQASLLKHHQHEYKCTRAWDVDLRCASSTDWHRQVCQGRYHSRSQRKHDKSNTGKAPTDIDAYWRRSFASQWWTHTYQWPLTSGAPLAGFGKRDPLISLVQSQMHPPPTKSSQLVSETPQALKKQNSPKPCHSKFPNLSLHTKVITTSHLLEAHTSIHSLSYSEDP